jgi:hypothetical protein
MPPAADGPAAQRQHEARRLDARTQNPGMRRWSWSTAARAGCEVQRSLLPNAHYRLGGIEPLDIEPVVAEGRREMQ